VKSNHGEEKEGREEGRQEAEGDEEGQAAVAKPSRAARARPGLHSDMRTKGGDDLMAKKKATKKKKKR
jgi:hypothetical protein